MLIEGEFVNNLSVLKAHIVLAAITHWIGVGVTRNGNVFQLLFASDLYIYNDSQNVARFIWDDLQKILWFCNAHNLATIVAPNFQNTTDAATPSGVSRSRRRSCVRAPIILPQTTPASSLVM
jgi:hypothetical protein